MSHSARVAIVAIDEASHAKTLFDWRQSPEIARFMYTREELVWEAHIAWIRSLPENLSRRDFVVTLDGALVGSVNLSEIDASHRRCVFGMYIAEPQARVQGVGAAAEVLILQHAFEDLDMHKVSCEVFANNPAPVAMHQRMGFEIEGTLRDHVHDDGQWIDVVRMSLLAEDWPPKFAQMKRLLARLLEPK